MIRAAATDDTNIIFGATVDDRLNGQVWVTVVATGFGGRGRRPRGDAWTAPAEQPRRPQGEGGDLDVPVVPEELTRRSTVDSYLAIASKRDERAYADTPVPDDVGTRILDAGRLSGSSRNRQRWEFVVVFGGAQDAPGRRGLCAGERRARPRSSSRSSARREPSTSVAARRT